MFFLWSLVTAVPLSHSTEKILRRSQRRRIHPKRTNPHSAKLIRTPSSTWILLSHTLAIDRRTRAEVVIPIYIYSFVSHRLKFEFQISPHESMFTLPLESDLTHMTMNSEYHVCCLLPWNKSWHWRNTLNTTKSCFGWSKHQTIKKLTKATLKMIIQRQKKKKNLKAHPEMIN